VLAFVGLGPPVVGDDVWAWLAAGGLVVVADQAELQLAESDVEEIPHLGQGRQECETDRGG
jgi:hypothetical protein